MTRLLSASGKARACPAIDAIVPVDLARRPVDLLRRIKRLCEQAPTQALSLVIGHNDRGSSYDAALQRVCRRHAVRLVSQRLYRGGVNTAWLRNAAMSAARAPLTLLLDADLMLPDDTVRSAAASIANGAFPFRILPCLYLSRRGAADLRRRAVEPRTLIDAYLRFKRAAFLHMALPSSVVLFQTQDFARSGGFDTGFSGHGYEDFDFLLRLAWLHGSVPRTPDLLTDCPSRAPLLALGFRAHLARLALPGMLRREIAFHCWHPVARDDYYAARSRNARRLREKIMAEIDLRGSPVLAPVLAPALAPERTIDMPLLRVWLELCERHDENPRDYLILFDNRPGHVDRFDSLTRKLRFLMGRY